VTWRAFNRLITVFGMIYANIVFIRRDPVERLMEQGEIEVFAICAAAGIAPGEARSFRLSRVTETGEARPFSIFLVRDDKNGYFGYLNLCPHEKAWLNIGSGEFLTPDKTSLRCGRHGALFDISTGQCTDGPCKGASLEPIALAVIGGDVCICGVALMEDDSIYGPPDELEDTMEIVIHP
jgi:nitrite reductase/ring-hydroxylating ferredoxin subunit